MLKQFDSLAKWFGPVPQREAWRLNRRHMKKSLMWFLFGALLAVGSLAMSARAQSNVVYAVEFNQSHNRFGTIDLWTGNFTQISAIGDNVNQRHRLLPHKRDIVWHKQLHNPGDVQ